ncbi:MAG: ATP-binding protein [bacterium]
MRIQKRHNETIWYANLEFREWFVLATSLLVAFAVAIIGVIINFNEKLARFFRPHADSILVQFVINFLVLWVIILLISSYIRWRRAALKNEELEDIIASISPDVLLVVDPNRNILTTSVSVLRMFGHHPREVLGRKTDLIYSDRRNSTSNKHEIYDALEREGFHIGWATGKRKDGRTFPLEIISGVLKRHGGSVLLLRDITERKNAEELLLEREMQLRQSQKMEALGLLAGGVAHDFNNLLTSILGFGSLAVEALPEGHSAKLDVQEVLNSAERAAKLTAQLLAIGRRQSLQIQCMNLNESVAGMVLLLKRTLGEDIALDIQMSPEPEFIEADSGGIEQVILNLAVNARDAMPKGGTLRIKTHCVTLDKGYCDAHVSVEPGRYGVLEIKDSGCGMAPAVQEHIFEPFFTTKERGRGTGLGLSMVYGIVRQCHGYIEVDSQVNAGTEFRIYLPSAEGVTVTGGGDSTAQVKVGSETILVVEDDAPVRGCTQRILTELGYQVLAVASPEEALKICSDVSKSIHLIISDIVLPGMSGSVLLKQIKSFRPDVKVLYVTGFDQESAIKYGVDPVFDHILVKPYKQAALAGKLREILNTERIPVEV